MVVRGKRTISAVKDEGGEFLNRSWGSSNWPLTSDAKLQRSMKSKRPGNVWPHRFARRAHARSSKTERGILADIDVYGID